MEILQYFKSGVLYMAEFKVNDKTDNGVICEEDNNLYICTGHTFYKNLTKHYLTEEQAQELNEFKKILQH